MLQLEEVRRDVSAFADDPDDVAIEDSGRILFVRNGIEVDCRVSPGTGESPDMVIMGDGTPITYGKFLTHELARMDVLAEKLIEMRRSVPFYVDGQGVLTRPGESPRIDNANALLHAECTGTPAFAARVAFLTADAGHGKTALLRHYQHQVAQDFRRGSSGFLFWHVDLQGRQLLRLSEALMGDLAELRYSGLWMPGVIRLMQRRRLVLAVDGFDELSAEQGDADALGALTSLVDQLEGRGVIVAAARRTFFDAEDYATKTALIKRSLASACHFDQIGLLPWGPAETTQYLDQVLVEGRSFENSQAEYANILSALGGDAEHPMLTRPFLVSQLAKALLTTQLPPENFVSSETDPMSGVAAVVSAFIQREVTEKWVFLDTGAPYLTQEQHLELLATVAEEMYRNQKDRLRLDTVETLAAILMDQWGIPAGRQAQVMDMVRSHVLLVLPPDMQQSFRAFDHPEFRDFFVAQALKGHLVTAMNSGDAGPLARFLSYAPLSDGTAGYVCGMVERNQEDVARAIEALCTRVRDEWRPTHLQTNAGTLVAKLLDGVSFEALLMVDAPLVLSSLVFEHSHIANVRFIGCHFVNLSLRGARWTNVSIVGSEISELRIDRESSFFTQVLLEQTKVSCVKVSVEAEEEEREYSPKRISALLEGFGIDTGHQPALELSEEPQDHESWRLARRLFSLYSRSTTVTDHMVTNRFHNSGNSAWIVESLVPLAIRHELLEERPWRGGGSGRVWVLRRSLDEILSAVDQPTNPAHRFWAELAKL